MPFLNSSAIARVEYDPHSRDLQIWFRTSGGPYTYVQVPASVYAGLLSAPSAGRYFDTYIRDQYSLRK